jgi:hypothetical protein
MWNGYVQAAVVFCLLALAVSQRQQQPQEELETLEPRPKKRRNLSLVSNLLDDLGLTDVSTAQLQNVHCY